MTQIQAINYQKIGYRKAAAIIKQGLGRLGYKPCRGGRKVPRPGYEVRVWSDGHCNMYVKNESGRFVLYHVELP